MVAIPSGSVIIHSMMKTQTNQIIPADQIGAMVYDMLVQSVENEYKGSTQEEKDLAVYHILETLSRQFFH